MGGAMDGNTKYFYKDIVTGKIHWTRCRFAGWTRGGIINAWYAVFARRNYDLLVPEYLLTKETYAALPPKPKEVIDEQAN